MKATMKKLVQRDVQNAQPFIAGRSTKEIGEKQVPLVARQKSETPIRVVNIYPGNISQEKIAKKTIYQICIFRLVLF